MLTITRPTTDPFADALTWISSRGIEVVHCTSDRFTPISSDGPVLYLIDRDAPPPATWGELEDWVRLPADPGELYHRADRLISRANGGTTGAIRVDQDDVLRSGSQLVPLTPVEARLVEVLLDNVGELVPRDALEAWLWPDGLPPDGRALDNRIKRLRHRLDGLPLHIHTVRGRGFLLEQTSQESSGW